MRWIAVSLAVMVVASACGSGQGELVEAGALSGPLTSTVGDLTDCPVIGPVSEPSTLVDLAVLGTTGPRGELAVQVANVSDDELVIGRERYAFVAEAGDLQALTRPPDWEVATDNLPAGLGPGQTTTVYASVALTPCGPGDLQPGAYDIAGVVLVRGAGASERLIVRAPYQID